MDRKMDLLFFDLPADVVNLIVLECSKDNYYLVVLRCTCRWFRDHIKPVIKKDREFMCNFMAERGYFNVVKWAYIQLHYFVEGQTCSWAAYHNRKDVIIWLREEGIQLDPMAIGFAASRGHLELIKWLRSEGAPWDSISYEMAARDGHLDVLKWLLAEGCPTGRREDQREIWIRAVTSGKRDVIEWVENKLYRPL
jgi:hypothetical protein